MSTLSLSLLGPFQARLGDQELRKFRTNKVQALFIFLAVECNAAHRREALMELLWPGLPAKSAQEPAPNGLPATPRHPGRDDHRRRGNHPLPAE